MPEMNIWTLLLLILAWIGFVLIIREIVCWYYKINRIAETLDKIDQRSTRIVQVLENIDRNLAFSISNKMTEDEDAS